MEHSRDIRPEASQALAGIWRDSYGVWGCDPGLLDEVLEEVSPAGQDARDLLPLIQRALGHLALVGEYYREDLIDEDARGFASDQAPKDPVGLTSWLAGDPVARMRWADIAAHDNGLSEAATLEDRLRSAAAHEAAWVLGLLARALIIR